MIDQYKLIVHGKKYMIYKCCFLQRKIWKCMGCICIHAPLIPLNEIQLLSRVVGLGFTMSSALNISPKLTFLITSNTSSLWWRMVVEASWWGNTFVNCPAPHQNLYTINSMLFCKGERPGCPICVMLADPHLQKWKVIKALHTFHLLIMTFIFLQLHNYALYLGLS